MNAIQSETSPSPELARAAAIIGWLFTTLGAVTLCGGILLWSVGESGIKRYGKTTGKLARVFSTGDQSNYGGLRFVRGLGAAAVGAGAIFTVAGIASIRNTGHVIRVIKTERSISLRAVSGKIPPVKNDTRSQL